MNTLGPLLNEHVDRTNTIRTSVVEKIKGSSSSSSKITKTTNAEGCRRPKQIVERPQPSSLDESSNATPMLLCPLSRSPQMLPSVCRLVSEPSEKDSLKAASPGQMYWHSRLRQNPPAPRGLPELHLRRSLSEELWMDLAGKDRCEPLHGSGYG